jgi:hypothetical protein
LTLDATENPALPEDHVRASIQQAAEAWSAPTAGCDVPSLGLLSGQAAGKGVAYDGTNLIVWRLRGFCNDPKNESDEVCNSPNAAAVTTVFYYDKPGDDKDGELLEADIELNATHFDFSDEGEEGKVDLQNTMTHELGHVLGLDHTCTLIAGAAPPIDSVGHVVPFCIPISQLPAEVTSATMFTFEALGETTKRMPRDDEWRGVCTIYAGRPNACQSGVDSGCQLVASARGLPLWVAALSSGAACVLVWRALRRRKRQ